MKYIHFPTFPTFPTAIWEKMIGKLSTFPTKLNGGESGESGEMDIILNLWGNNRSLSPCVHWESTQEMIALTWLQKLQVLKSTKHTVKIHSKKMVFSIIAIFQQEKMFWRNQSLKTFFITAQITRSQNIHIINYYWPATPWGGCTPSWLRSELMIGSNRRRNGGESYRMRRSLRRKVTRWGSEHVGGWKCL